jgi:uncharacterized protein (TIGR03083 family)
VTDYSDSSDSADTFAITSAWLTAVRSSQDRFAGLLTGLSADQVTGASYDTEWSIADVASHLGSQAEIFELFVDAAQRGADAPGGEVFQPIWDRWNAKAPVDQVADSVAANEALVARIEGLTGQERAEFSLNLFGTVADLAGFAAMRLGEHAVHTWDIAVALDSSAVVADDAVDLLVDRLAAVAARTGKPTEDERSISIGTSDPERTFVLATGPDVELAPANVGEVVGDPDLNLPAEALLRLVYGRLDPDHTPETATGEDLPQLRAVFPGF